MRRKTKEAAIRKKTKQRKKLEVQNVARRIGAIVKKSVRERSAEEKALLARHPKLTQQVRRRVSMRQQTEDRKREVEDPPEVLRRRCQQLAKAISGAKNLVAYTGAGISTAADIPDYRGPNGIWTLLDQGRSLEGVDGFCRDLALAQPTYTHMALLALYRRGKLKHIVSQNCDGLHLRSGIPRYALSELHGNMFIEVCRHCKPNRPFVRLFDVTERTNKHRHPTLRRCRFCGHSLHDTIVHFGERLASLVSY